MSNQPISTEAEALRTLCDKVRAHKGKAALAFTERAKALGQAAPPNPEPMVDFFLGMADAARTRATTTAASVSSDRTTRAAPAGELKEVKDAVKGVLGRARTDVITYFGQKLVGSAVGWPLPRDDARLAQHARTTADNLGKLVPTWKPLDGRAGAFDLSGTVALLHSTAAALDAARGHLGAHETTTDADTHDRNDAGVTLHDVHQGLLESFVGLLHLAGLRALADEFKSHHTSHGHTKPAAPAVTPAPDPAPKP